MNLFSMLFLAMSSHSAWAGGMDKILPEAVKAIETKGVGVICSEGKSLAEANLELNKIVLSLRTPVTLQDLQVKESTLSFAICAIASKK